MLDAEYVRRAIVILKHEWDPEEMRWLDVFLLAEPHEQACAEEVIAELSDLSWYGLPHGRPGSYNRGCRGPLCRRGNRIAQSAIATRQARRQGRPTGRTRSKSPELEALDVLLTRIQAWWEGYWEKTFYEQNATFGYIKRTVDQLSGEAAARKERQAIDAVVKKQLPLIGGALRVS